MYQKNLTFNTNRGYSADGQIITAVFLPERITDNGDQEGAIEFVDVTRGIDGRFENVCFTNREIFDGTFQARVIDLYDRGGYTNTKVIKLDLAQGGKYEVGHYATTLTCHFCKGPAEGEYMDDEGEVCNACETKYGESSRPENDDPGPYQA